MSQWKALALGLLFVAAAIVSLSAGQTACLVGFGGPGLLFAGIFAYKFTRDLRTILAAKERRELAASKEPTAPPMTSPDSTGLFVPPPLD